MGIAEINGIEVKITALPRSTCFNSPKAKKNTIM